MPFSPFWVRPPVSSPSAAVQVVVRVRPWSDREMQANVTPVVSVFGELHHSVRMQRHTTTEQTAATRTGHTSTIALFLC